MALFKILRGLSTNLDAQPLHDGFAYYTPDNNGFYIDHYNVEKTEVVRTRINPIISFENNNVIVSNEGEVIGVVSRAEFDAEMDNIRANFPHGDWRAANGEDGYIYNRTHFIEINANAASYTLSGISTYLITGRKYNNVDIYSTTLISNNIVIEEGKTYDIQWNNRQYKVIAEFDDEKYILGNGYLINNSYADNGNLICLTVDDGMIHIYTCDEQPTEIKIDEVNIIYHQLDEEYIPAMTDSIIDNICV